MKNTFKLKLLAVLTTVVMTVLVLPLQISAQNPPPRPGQGQPTTPAPPSRPGEQTPSQPAQPASQWVTNLPQNVDVVFQTTRAGTNVRNGIWSAQHSDSRNGSVIHLWDFTGQQNSIFRLHHMGDAWYVITNRVRGAVDIQGGRDDNGIAMIIWDRHDGGGQRFRIRRVSEGVFEFHTVHERTLNLQHGNTNNGNRIHTWRSAGNDENNKFRILQVGNNANLTIVR